MKSESAEHHLPCLLPCVFLLLTACSSAAAMQNDSPSHTSPPAGESKGGTEEPLVQQVFRAPDWTGAVNVTDGGCNASMGEYTLWVYSMGTKCGVPREQADRVSIIRQPLPGVAPIRALTQLPGGRYAIWVYGAGEAINSQVRLCARGCVIGGLPQKPAWAFLGWIKLLDNQTLYLRSWQQPETHLLYVQAVVLSSSETKPDWVP